jgi:hypothetical protein
MKMSSKMVGGNLPQFLCGECERIIVVSEAAESFNLRRDGNCRIRRPASLTGDFDRLIERS